MQRLQTIPQTSTKLLTSLSATTTPNSILAKLNALKQRDSFEKFTQGIEKLTLELERAYLNEKVPLDTATNLAASAGIKALTSGVKNDETKLLLKAGQFSILSKAVEKASENEAEKQADAANVYSFQRNNLYRGRPSSNHYRNNRGNLQNNRGNVQNNRGTFHQPRGNFQNNRGAYSRFNMGNATYATCCSEPF